MRHSPLTSMPIRTCLVLPLALSLMAGSSAALAQAERRLAPVDQAASMPDFFSFRARLQAAVARHDTAAVLAALGKDVELSFGGERGVEGFKAMWKPEAAGSLLWDTLATALALGGSFDGQGRFMAPYVASTWPRGTDFHIAVAAVAPGVQVRAAASDAAPVVASLDFSILDTADQAGEAAGWTAVKLPSGQTGYVRSPLVRSPLDYRVGFSKVAGRWQIDYFIAGD